MRAFLVIGILAAVGLAGCADEGVADPATDDSFGDVDVQVTADTGAIRGVVVNDAIEPIAGALIELNLAKPVTTKTDSEGRFSFSKIAPGTYFLTVSKVVHDGAQASVTVVAGDETPEIVKLQLNRLYDEDPYYETLQFAGFVGCAYSLGISSTCVNDYTRICNPDQVPVCCPGGCLPETTGVVDQREYQSGVGNGWQSIVWELVWESSLAGTAESMGLTVSYAAREGASHWFTSGQMGQPFRLQCNLAVDCPQMSESNGPPQIAPEGRDDLWNMISAGSGVVVQQDIEIFQNNFYFAPVDSEWSFVRGDPSPF